MTSISDNLTRKSETISLREAPSDELMKISSGCLLSLSVDEMKAIQKHFVSIERDPTDVELETIAQTWSEHCVHKTFKAAYSYQEISDESENFHKLGARSYTNLL